MKNKPGQGRPITTRSPWGDLYKATGGQETLANKIGVAKSTIAKWASCTHRVPELAKKELLRLCKYYGIKEGVQEFE
jgi:hypothetical protein